MENLSKTYADGTQAVKGISLAIKREEFFGFLGPNGAGKSTTIKILTTLQALTSGQVTVMGFDVNKNAVEVRKHIGYAAQETGIDDDLTGRENLSLQGKLFHLPKAELKARVTELLELMDLSADADRRAGGYSGGMRKRLDLASALIQRPEILFLDEPTTGLDPQTRANLWTYLERLNREEGLSIFLTTHYMEEADQLCGRLAIIDHGEIIAEGTPESLKAGLGGDVISLSLAEGVRVRAEELLETLPGVRSVNPVATGLQVVVDSGATSVPRIVQKLDSESIAVQQLSLKIPTLDDVFLSYTGKTIRPEEPTPKGRGGGFRARRRSW